MRLDVGKRRDIFQVGKIRKVPCQTDSKWGKLREALFRPIPSGENKERYC